MNLRKMLFWNTSPAAPVSGLAPSPSVAPAIAAPDGPNNVIPMPPRNPLTDPAGLDMPHDLSTPPPSNPSAGQPAGLMDAPELKAFFAENFFGLGRHNGIHYRTQEALEQGKQSLVSRFQNTLAALVAQRQAKVDRLLDMQVQTKHGFPTETEQLGLASSRYERDMNLLREQMALADAGKGWVLEALNRYQIGFGKGLREAIDFELRGN